MKFQPDTTSGVNLVSRQEPGRVWVGAAPHTASIIVPWEGAVLAWDAPAFESLTAAHFERIAALGPEVVIFGSGAKIRFPHPQLMPGDPVARARVRLFLFNFEKELFSNVNLLEGRGVKATEKQLEKARDQIRDRLTQLAPIFLKNKYMLGDDFSMLDVAIAPLLWRLDYYGIDLSKNAVPLLKYAERIFSRPAYIEALTPSEKVMRK